MAAQIYDPGDIARLTVAFKVDNVDTDPTAVSATVREPDGTVTVYTYNPGAIAKTSTGHYRLDVTADTIGEWAYKFVGTGAAADVGQGNFYVRSDLTATGAVVYCSRERLKAALSITSSTFDVDIDLACDAASRAIEQACGGRRFYPSDETRYYTADRWDSTLTLDDLLAITTVTVDTDGNGSYDQTWVEGTDFFLDPPNVDLTSKPYTRLVLRTLAGRAFPLYERGIKIDGTFGEWLVAPSGIVQYAEILAARLMRRARDAPFGFVTHGAADAAAFITRNDPDFNLLVGPYIRKALLV